MSTDLIVRFAGEGGQGQVTAAEGLAQAAGRVGYHVQTYSTYPSQIKGGPTWAQTRISTKKIQHDGDALDILVVLNREAYENHIGELREGGVLVYNAEDFELESNGNAVGIAVDELARSTGNPRAANMVVIGAVAALGGMPPEYFEDFIRERFTRGRDNDQQIIDANIEALKLGVQEVERAGFKVANLDDPPAEDGQRVVVKGNDVLALGAIASGLDVFVGYPISPATTILVFMEQNLMGDGKMVVQASSEIESISTIIGAR
jgi:2-oxoglutarate ferredoxin oxidoreductase subunit alpha